MAEGEVEVNFLLKEVEGLDGDLQALDFQSGAFGVVFKVSVNGVPCMAKKLHHHLTSPNISDEDQTAVHKKFKQECALMSRLSHPNIVHFMGMCYNRDDQLIIVMEQLRTDLARFVEKQPNIPESMKVLFLLDVSYGLCYLHGQSPPILHRDLTASNILLSDTCRAKIADLGISRVYHDSCNILTGTPGNVNYMAPETKYQNPRYGPSIDIFSFGHLTIHTSIQSWPKVFEVENVHSVVPGKLEIAKRKEALENMGHSNILYPLAIKCLSDNADERPSCAELNKMIVELSQTCRCTADDISYTAASLVGTPILLGKKLKELYQQNSSLSNDNSMMTVALKSSKGKIEELDEAMLDQDKEIQRLREMIKGYKEQKASYDKVIEDIEHENAALELKAQVYEEDFQTEREDRARAHSKIDEFETKLATAERKIEEQRIEILNLCLNNDSSSTSTEKSTQKPLFRFKCSSLSSTQAALLEENKALREELALVTTQLEKINLEQKAVKKRHHKKRSKAITITSETDGDVDTHKAGATAVVVQVENEQLKSSDTADQGILAMDRIAASKDTNYSD